MSMSILAKLPVLVQRYSQTLPIAITDDEIKTFDRIRRGLDWGYASDPFTYTLHYDTPPKLYIFLPEIQQTKLSNRASAKLVKAENKA